MKRKHNDQGNTKLTGSLYESDSESSEKIINEQIFLYNCQFIDQKNLWQDILPRSRKDMNRYANLISKELETPLYIVLYRLIYGKKHSDSGIIDDTRFWDNAETIKNIVTGMIYDMKDHRLFAYSENFDSRILDILMDGVNLAIEDKIPTKYVEIFLDMAMLVIDRYINSNRNIEHCPIIKTHNFLNTDFNNSDAYYFAIDSSVELKKTALFVTLHNTIKASEEAKSSQDSDSIDGLDSKSRTFISHVSGSLTDDHEVTNIQGITNFIISKITTICNKTKNAIPKDLEEVNNFVSKLNQNKENQNSPSRNF